MVYDPTAMATAILAMIIGTLAAIVYSLRVLVLMERRIARMDSHIEIITRKIADEEVSIERKEAAIMSALRADRARRVDSVVTKSVRKVTPKKVASKAPKKKIAKKTARRTKK